MHVVIVESPAKCKTINKYLGKGYTVLASFGHVRDLPSKDGSVRPDEDFFMDYKVSSGSKKYLKAISDAVKDADSLILATDPDREGEAISWHVLEAMKKKMPKDIDVKRISFSSITKKAVNDAMDNPREIDMDLVNAQQARRALDYLVGFNVSPVLWRKLPGSRSAGRVQSVALRIICEREAEREKFITQEYWDIKTNFNTPDKEKFTATLTHVDGKKLDKFALGNEKIAKNTEKRIADLDYSVEKVAKKQIKRNPYAPFITSTLQQEASRKLGFSAKRTMQVAQKLYEGITLGGETTGLITYMRTDGVTVAPEAIFATRDLIKNRYGEKYLPEKSRFYATKAKNAQEAHEAIRPTDPSRIPEQVAKYLDKDQIRLYDLIWKRLIASQMESVVMDQVSADILSNDKVAKFRAVGSTIRFDGFYKVYKEGLDDNSDDSENSLPNLIEGMKVDPLKINTEQHFTQPPPRFTEATLVKRLEELSIGRPSTYASIISVLQDREYVTLDKKRFIPEMRGRLVTEFLSNFFAKYVEYDFTANLEEELDKISAGELNWKKSLGTFWGDFTENVDVAMKLEFTDVLTTLDTALDHLLFPEDGSRKCPDCGDGKLGLKLGKFGAFLGCSKHPECKYTKQLSGSGTGNSDTGGSVEPVLLGSENGLDIVLKKGPFGFYVQLGEAEGKKKPKRASLPKGMNPEDMTLEAASSLLALPREVGTHPETGKIIEASIGRFGPYVKHDGKFVSLKGDDDVLTIAVERAVEVIAQSGKAKSNEPIRIIGKHPEDESDIAVYDGRYGLYVKHKKLNASIPKNLSVDKITLEEAVQLLEDRKTKVKAKPKKKKA